MRQKAVLVRDKAFYGMLAGIALPIILQNMITIGVNIMDTVMLGKMGEVQISASSLANNYIDFFHILHMGIGGGAGVLISQYSGLNDKKSVRNVVTIAIIISLCASTLFATISGLFPSQIMRIFTPDPAVVEKGDIYLRWSIPSYYFHGLSLIMTLALRSTGKVKVPFFASIVSFFVNIFSNWVFIFGNLGAPRMEIAGAALGTLIARIAEALFIGIYFFTIEKDISFRIRDLFRPTEGKLKIFLRYGIPVIISDSLLSLGNSTVSIIIGHISTSFVAAFAIVVPVMRLCNVATMGLSQASATMTGKTVGSGSIEDIKSCGLTCYVLSIATGMVASVLIMLVCPFVIGLYEISSETAVIARHLMFSIAVMVIFQSIQTVLTKGILRGGGDTRFVMVADVLFMWILSIPLGALLGLVLHVDPFFIYMALKGDFIVKSVWCSKRLFSWKWIRKVYI